MPVVPDPAGQRLDGQGLGGGPRVVQTNASPSKKTPLRVGTIEGRLSDHSEKRRDSPDRSAGLLLALHTADDDQSASFVARVSSHLDDAR